MSPQLVAKDQGPTIPLDKPIVIVGRQQECDIQIASRKISRKHCCIAQVNDYLVVRDLFSTNGIRINGVKVVEGRLSEGDELIIGNVAFEVRLNAVKNGVKEGRRANGRVSPESIQSTDQPVALQEPTAKTPSPPPAKKLIDPEASLIPSDVELADED